MLFGLLLAGCGGGGGGGETEKKDQETPPPVETGQTLIGYVVNGPIAGATVRVEDGNGVFLGEATSDGQGGYRLEGISASPPYRITARGGLLDGQPYAGILEAECSSASCHATPITTAVMHLAREKKISYTEAGETLNNWLGLSEDPFIASYQGRPLEKPDMESLRVDLQQNGLDVWLGKLLDAYDDGTPAEELGFGKVNTYTIRFDSAGGSAVRNITQAIGSDVTAPAAPTREGYTFNGWNPALPSTMPLNGANLTAQWTANSYTINFDSSSTVQFQ